MNPQLAKDAVESKLRFPIILQPKIDGVRGHNVGGQLFARSNKKFPNKHVDSLFSGIHLLGYDGELTAGNDPVRDRLCSWTTSAVTSHAGYPEMHWWLFDRITAVTADLPYEERIQLVHSGVQSLGIAHIHAVDWHLLHNMDDVLKKEEEYLDLGYEGIILRNPKGLFKSGRSTITIGELLRVKRFVEEEAIVTSITEGEKNNNDQTTNELGRSTRSSHAANKEPNGMVGNLICTLCKDVLFREKKILSRGQEITVSPGNMSHEERAYYFRNQNQLIGKTIKFKFFPIGIKDKPRMPTFVSVRSAVDM